MCGFTGIFHTNGEPVSPSILRKMTDAIAHRGPDGEGFYTDRFIGLGHRRLAILDLSSAGHQPMMTANKEQIIVYNGEVYNFQELRAELEAEGCQFRSKTDTEVVLKAYAVWKEEALLKFNGMFSFAVWDRSRQELFIARDRYGIKPVYYCTVGDTFLFGSEVKSLIPHPKFSAVMDKEALLEYMTFQNFFTDKTLFSGVKILPPGSSIRIALGARVNPIPKRYWDFDFSEPKNPSDPREYQEELERLFEQAVYRQLVSDVELGSYLSGGMDSGSITAKAASQLPYLKTFTVGFDLTSISGIELACDERELAEHMSSAFKTEHYEMVLKAGDMVRIMQNLCWHLEEPRVGQCYPNFYAAQLAGKFLKVVLAGTGGDELFGGYPWRYYRAANNKNFEDYIDKYYLYWQRLIPNRDIHEIFRPIWGDVSHIQTRNIFKNVFSGREVDVTHPEEYLNHSLYFEAKTFLHGLLVVEDKMSMAHSLESRVPFLDNDLVDFAMKLPASLKVGRLSEVASVDENEAGDKIAKYFAKTKDGKLILRKAMESVIPSSITKQVKQGFSAPDSSWFKGESMQYVHDTLMNKQANIYNYFDHQATTKLVQEHLEGKKNRRLLVWSLLNLEQWCLQFE